MVSRRVGEDVVSPYLVEKLDPERFRHYWPQIEKELDNVPHIWAYWWTKESIVEFVLEGRFQCWTVGTERMVQGVLFSQIAHYPANAIFQVLFAFGEGMSEMLDELDATMSKFAVFNGCAYAEVIGRPGWQPKLRRQGFRYNRTVLMKEFEPIRMN